MKFLSLAAALGALALAGSANASVIFSENFNAAGFQGGSLGLNANEQFSDRWLNVDYTNINNFNGWSFSPGGAYYVRNTTNTSEGAVLLNENAGGGIALHMLNGLVQGRTYAVSLLLSGDNRPGGTYTFKADANAANVFTQSGTDLAAGTNPGATVNFTFVAGAGPNTLTFYQTGSIGEASPIIDNVSVSDAVPEPATWALMILGFGSAGAMLRRRRSALA